LRGRPSGQHAIQRFQTIKTNEKKMWSCPGEEGKSSGIKRKKKRKGHKANAYRSTEWRQKQPTKGDEKHFGTEITPKQKKGKGTQQKERCLILRLPGGTKKDQQP